MGFAQELKLTAARISGMKEPGARIQPQPLRRLCPRHVRAEAPEPRKMKVRWEALGESSALWILHLLHS